MLFAMVSSWSGDISLAILAGRSASTVAGAQTSLSGAHRARAAASRRPPRRRPALGKSPARRAPGPAATRRRGRCRFGERGDRIGVLAVPEGIERGGQLRHDGSGADQVEVDEITVLVEREVLVADIAPAGDGKSVIGDEQLVVHPMIDPRNIRYRSQNAAPDGRAAAGEGLKTRTSTFGCCPRCIK